MSLPKHWKTVPLAEHLGISVADIERATEIGDLVPVKIGRTLLYSEEEARRWAMFPNRGKATRIYFIQEGDDGPVKIGESTQPERRMEYHQCGNPRRLRLLGSYSARAYDEKALLARFADHRIRGEWFEPAPELLAHVEEMCR